MFESLPDEWRVLTALVGLAVFFCWESAAPFFEQRRRGLHARRNLAVAGVNVLLVGVCCAGVTVAVAELSATNGLGLLNQLSLPPTAALAAAFVALDLWTYWWHRANHRIPLLWRFHRMHHSDPSVDVTTAARFHTGELLISAGLRLLLIPLLGLPLTALVLYDGVVLAATQFHHANVGLADAADSGLRRLIVSPNMHKLHHSRIQSETDSNYATVFSGWDRLFRTYRDRDDYRAIEFGIAGLEDDRSQTLAGLALTPFLQSRDR